MAISEEFQASQSITTTEHDLPTDTTTLTDNTTDGIRQFFLDLNLLAAGDVFEFRLYEAISSAGTRRRCFTQTFTGAQTDDIWASPTFIFLHKWTATLIKLTGTDRVIDWSIRKVA